MKESEIKVFVHAVQNYFSTHTEHEAVVSTPYLTPANDMPGNDYTGIIGISGDRKGCVYITAPRILLHHLLLAIGELEVDEQLLSDIAGELANTISGNVRETFGPGFMISVPVVIKGTPENIQIPNENRAFIVPFKWKSYSADIVVCLTD